MNNLLILLYFLYYLYRETIKVMSGLINIIVRRVKVYFYEVMADSMYKMKVCVVINKDMLLNKTDNS